MTVNELIAIIISFANAELAAANMSDVTLVQKIQPTQQGVVAGRAAYIEVLDTYFRGNPGVSHEYNPSSVAQTFYVTESQLTESHFQISVIARTLEAEDSVVAKDIAEYMSLFFQSRKFVHRMVSSGASILRVSKVRNSTFTNESKQFAFHPSFDIVISHTREYTDSVPAVSKFNPSVYSV